MKHGMAWHVALYGALLVLFDARFILSVLVLDPYKYQFQRCRIGVSEFIVSDIQIIIIMFI